MVARCRFLLLVLACLLPSVMPALVTRVLADIEAAKLAEGRQLEGTIQVLHDADQDVDVESFRMEKRPLVVEFVKFQALPDELRADHPDLGRDAVMSIFRFQIPGKPKGLYILPMISVKIDGKRHRSVASTYEVTATQASSSLELEAVVEGDAPFYPGQSTILRYRIYYSRSIELTEEHFPLLEAEGLQKVGDKQIHDYQTDVYTVQEISQEVRFDEPGMFTFGPSYIEGVAYDEDILGKRVYDKQRLRAVTPEVHLSVSAFPEQDRPPSFTGAVGQYSMKGRLLTSPEIQIGDKVEVAVKIVGTGELDSIIMPDVSCQPGFSGFFQMGEYPPFELREGSSREFIIALRPLSAHVTEVPKMEFAFFDPHTRQYRRVNTEPIALSVHGLSSYRTAYRTGREDTVVKEGPLEDLEAQHEFISGVDWRVWLGRPDDIRIESAKHLKPEDFRRPLVDIGTLWMALAIALLLLIVQLVVRYYRSSQKEVSQSLNSEDYLALAGKHRRDPAKMAQMLEQALVLLLQEKGIFSGEVASPELLPTEGVSGEVRTFLCQMHNERFSGDGEFIPKQVLSRAKTLYRQIRYGRG